MQGAVAVEMAGLHAQAYFAPSQSRRFRGRQHTTLPVVLDADLRTLPDNYHLRRAADLYLLRCHEQDPKELDTTYPVPPRLHTFRRERDLTVMNARPRLLLHAQAVLRRNLSSLEQVAQWHTSACTTVAARSSRRRFTPTSYAAPSLVLKNVNLWRRVSKMEAASTTEEPPDTANASPSQLVAVSELISAGGKTEREAARSEGIPRWTLNDWRKDEESIFAYERSEKTLSRAPRRPERVPFSGELITFMKDARRESLLRLLRRFAYRHGFVQRTPSGLKEKLSDLVALRDEFAEMFKSKYVGYEVSIVFNTDETGIYFDMPPSKMLSEKGKPASITAEQKHSARLTAVCTVCADGRKLPLLFIVRGEPGGTIEQTELPTYPKGTHFIFFMHGIY
ncbi:hypothetical protein ON010_g1179 [Phytophthora cinnamomi]|nr:hypothetical protein ON010_g1179 [Phytophthora cinnamomi]